MYLLNSPYDKITIIMIRQSNASILVHNKAINVVLQTGQVTRQPYNMLCHCITSILIQTYRLHKSATPHGFLLFLGSRTAVLLLNLGNCILLQTPPFAGYGDVWVHCVTRLMKLNLTFHLVFKKKLAIKSSVEVLNFHIYCIVRCELKKTIFLGRKMSFTKHFLRWEAKYWKVILWPHWKKNLLIPHLLILKHFSGKWSR